MPARSTAEMWTNTSFPPSCGSMKPKPFWELKNLTVPVAMAASTENAEGASACCTLFRSLTSEFDVVFGRALVGQKQEQAKSRTNTYMGPERSDINLLHE